MLWAPHILWAQNPSNNKSKGQLPPTVLTSPIRRLTPRFYFIIFFPKEVNVHWKKKKKTQYIVYYTVKKNVPTLVPFPKCNSPQQPGISHSRSFFLNIWSINLQILIKRLFCVKHCIRGKRQTRQNSWKGISFKP